MPDVFKASQGGSSSGEEPGSATQSVSVGQNAFLIAGDAGGNTLTGTDEDDRIQGKKGNDSILGLDGDDNISADQGDDTVKGGPGDDFIDGDKGFDTAVYDGSILDFVFSPPSGGTNTVFITDLNTTDGNEGTDELKKVEALQFDDFLYLIGQDNAPLITSAGGNTNEDSPGTFIVNAYDFEGDALQAPVVTYAGPGTITLVSTTPLTPAVGSGSAFEFQFDPAGQFEYLAAGTSAVELISVQIADANGNTSMVELAVTVTGVNDAPVAEDDAATTDEDVATLIDVLGNDSDVDLGDIIGVTAASAANGTVVVQADGQLLYTPDPNFNGTDTITYEITDLGGLTSTATVTVTVNPVPDAPVAEDDSATTDEDTAVTFAVLGNDYDVDIGDTISVTDASAANGTVVIELDGQLTYTPNLNFNGTDTITYEITDSTGLTDTATVTVTVNPVNDPPVAQSDTATVNEDTPTLIDVLGNDSDVDIGDTLTVTSATALNGTVAVQANGQLLYTPDPNYFGSDTITYEITDSGGLTSTATVAVTVNPVNDAPQSLDIPVTINEGDGVTIIDLSTQATDIDGDALTFSNIVLTRDSAPIPFTLVGPGLIRIDPADLGLSDGQSVSVTFQYLVTDDSGAANNSDSGIVPVTVNGGDTPPPVNAPPVASAITVVADEGDGPVSVSLAGLVSDPDTATGDVLTITSLTRDIGGTPVAVPFSGGITAGDGGTLSFDPAIFGLEEGETGTFVLTYVVRDAAGLTATNTITLDLTGDTPGTGNTPPTAISLPTGPEPTDIIIDDPASTTLTVDMFALIADAETADADLVVTIGGLQIGFDEATGQPILADGALSYNDVTGILTVDLTAIPVPDGDSRIGVIGYTVSDGTASAAGQIVYNYVNPADGPAPDTTYVLDFEEFQFADPEFQGPVPGSMGFDFSGVATAIETDELGGDGRAPTGIVGGQTTSGGGNVLVGTYSTQTVVTPVLDEFGQPVRDEEGNPVLEVVEVPDEDFAILAPGLPFGVGGPGQLIGTTLPGQSIPVPAIAATAFDVSSLSLNPVAGDGVTVTITVYTIGVVETANTNNPGLSDYFASLVAVDSFDFIVDASTPASQIDFTALDFGLGLTGANPDPTIFDDIYAISITTADGTAIVLDDVVLTA
ncbi:Ig-like domain-containing protein [Tropicibacter sp. S64]|uniref:Ig-like domain-containing protein n=1 Tax=Tropicibacter sp. S64 TaxID=3415122 RepID=UPI003C7B0F8A